MAIYFQGAGEHWLLFSGIWGASSQFWGFREPCKKVKKISPYRKSLHFVLIKKKSSASGWEPPDPPPPPPLEIKMYLLLCYMLMVTGRANLFDYCCARIQKVLSEGVQIC